MLSDRGGSADTLRDQRLMHHRSLGSGGTPRVLPPGAFYWAMRRVAPTTELPIRVIFPRFQVSVPSGVADFETLRGVLASTF